RELGIEAHITQQHWRSYEETDKEPFRNSTRNLRCLTNFTEEHKVHVLYVVDDDPQATVCGIVKSLTKSFEDSSLTKSVIHKYKNKTCNLSVKK
ncbi:MAG: hypothetical protein EXX96DRAFT_457413, partial [Benjaminiella poitrasii]